jgi:hypothetical protein
MVVYIQKWLVLATVKAMQLVVVLDAMTRLKLFRRPRSVRRSPATNHMRVTPVTAL